MSGPAEPRALRRLPPRKHASRLAFAGLLAANLLIGSICLVDGLGWIGDPFPGFLLNERMYVNGMGSYGWTGSRAGLKFPDRILEAGGVPVATPKEVGRVVHAVEIGEPVLYRVERGDRALEISIPTMRFGGSDLFVVMGILFLVGLAYLAIGTVVFLLKPDTMVTWSFCLLAFAVSTFCLTAFDVGATHRGFVRGYLFALALGPAAGLHLAMLFPARWPVCRRHPRIQLVPYLVAAVLIVPLQWFYPHPSFLPYYQALYLYLVLASVVFVGSSLVSYRRPASELARQRSKVVLFGAAMAFPIVALGELAMFTGTTIGGFQVQANFLAIPFTLFPGSIAFAIARHNLFDVDVYIKRALGYGIMTVVVGLTYFGIQSGMHFVMSRTLAASEAETLSPIGFALAVVLLFNPVNQRVQGAVSRVFFRKPYDYKATVEAISRALRGLVDLEAFLQRVLGIVRTELFVDRAGVILVDARQRACSALFLQDAGADGTDPVERPAFGYDDPLLDLLAREGRLVSRYDVAEDPRFAAAAEVCGARFDELGATLAFPLSAEGAFAGALTLGRKKSGHFYSRDDVDLLATGSEMISTAIEQAREKGQRSTLMQLFSKHVSPEVAEALWEQREQVLEGGRPRPRKITATVLFTDLRGFSSVAEKLDPQELLDWLNTYMDGITRVVMSHGGVVDDYFGDGVKANFGVPLPRSSEEEIRDDAVRAVDCALALGEEVVRLNAAMAERGIPTIQLRVGIYTGPVVAGSLGSADRMKYTTLGDTVNTAARLESYEKDLAIPRLGHSPARILIGDATLRLVGDRYDTESVGEFELRGKDERVAVHCVLARRPEAGDPPVA